MYIEGVFLIKISEYHAVLWSKFSYIIMPDEQALLVRENQFNPLFLFFINNNNEFYSLLLKMFIIVIWLINGCGC